MVKRSKVTEKNQFSSDLLELQEVETQHLYRLDHLQEKILVTSISFYYNVVYKVQ